jgi:hypothetical protein
VTGKVYEGVPLHLTVQKHSIKGREEVVYGISPEEWKVVHGNGVW